MLLEDCVYALRAQRRGALVVIAPITLPSETVVALPAGCNLSL
jgi:hypothetical protein